MLELNIWQKRQAALLYHFASLDYLKGLKRLIDALIQGADELLDLAAAQGRDALIVNERWGARDTSGNWSTYGFPALLDFQQTTAKDIARRAYEAYGVTGARQCARLLAELSMRWATEEEEQRFNDALEVVMRYAGNIDRTIQRPRTRNDGIFFNIWNGVESEFPSLCVRRHAALFPSLPKFRVRTDVEAVSGQPVPRTGVYVPQDDPFGALQFGWTGDAGSGSLDVCQTFNEFGVDAVKAIGRDKLWSNSQELLSFVKQTRPREFETYLKEEEGPRFDLALLNDSAWATIFLADRGYTKRACKWHFVERVNDEFDELADTGSGGSDGIAHVAAGKPCPRPGYWFTPAKTGSRRYFRQGDTFPEIEGSSYGATFWQWSADQSDPQL